MSLLFTGNNTEKVEWTIQTPAVNLGPWTIWAWIYPTALIGGSGIFQSDNGTGSNYRTMNLRDTGQLDIGMQMTTTGVNARSNTSNQVAINVWSFVAGTVDASFVPRIYLGSLTTTVIEVTGYTTQTTGVGAKTSDSGGTARWGNRGPSNTLSIAGRIAYGGYLNTNYTVAQLAALQFAPRVTTETVLFHQLGHNGVGTQRDYSGNGHTGTLTGSPTVADDPPVMSQALRLRQRRFAAAGGLINLMAGKLALAGKL